MLFTRSFVCDKLALSRWQSYRFFPVTKTGMIRESDVLQHINAMRGPSTPPFSHVLELATTERLSELTGAPVRKLKLWAHRKRNPIPYVRFNSHTLRFPVAQARAWLGG
jgi:hypothetical protein